MSTDNDGSPLDHQRVTVMEQTIDDRRGEHVVAEHQPARIPMLLPSISVGVRTYEARRRPGCKHW